MSENGADGATQPVPGDSADLPAAAPLPSAVGGMADLKDGEVLLPVFVERRAAGLFVDPLVAGEPGFLTFVERVFTAAARFVDLDYTVFQALLYGQAEMKSGPVKLAAAIVPFPPERRALYRAVKISPDKSKAEYLFEPVEIEVEETVPLFGPPAADGSAEVVGEEIRKSRAPTRLDFDEFVAALWEKGVRFGIAEKAVREAIQSSQPVRLVIAQALQPTLGQDASIEEKTTALHRDNAPMIMPNGRMDLRHFKNRFPQITADVRLLKKIPRWLGKSGRSVTGLLLEPVIPKDFDLAAQAGPGTRVERCAEGEFIVSAMDGFLNIDKQNHLISVTEKIVSHEGVSMRTTGDVSLTGDEFEEHGEVQERRVVEGRHMTFFADVYGNIISHGGRVLLKTCLAGGHIDSPGGSITVEGRASRAVLEARGGDIHVEFAESSRIVGSRVTVKHAVNCDILGEEVSIGFAEGCAIAGKQIRIAKSGARKDIETIVALLVPDFTRHEHEVAELEEARQQAAKRIAAHSEKLAQLLGDAGFKQYMALALTIAKGGAKLSATQEASWRQTQASYAQQLRDWQAAQEARASAEKKLDQLTAELAALAERKLQAGTGIACAIEEICGDTLVRRMAFQPDQPVVGGEQAQELAAHLREYGMSNDRLFWAPAGSFAWGYGDAIPGEG
ncbi:MAG: FapA family protein [Gammaproteobacteria bacterium]|nr:DUF342 domain-containing protein [Rhodocyclaceae bacterium]MBU3908111.1 FapA family protein [Gammaproteobacteria bacterium]MBU3989008.1 FapA family protein [Gammaproteobacteria bacterium]MBU4005752.1 FapA family protein [Gammaproteobacteria bacterium]MBU4021500.1 FapA family protein [Gammaproteobacteria bacterium]